MLLSNKDKQQHKQLLKPLKLKAKHKLRLNLKLKSNLKLKVKPKLKQSPLLKTHCLRLQPTLLKIKPKWMLLLAVLLISVVHQTNSTPTQSKE